MSTSWKPRGSPTFQLNESLKGTPHCELRQRSDLSTLMSHNQNPRINELTRCDVKRSESYLPRSSGNDMERKIRKVTARSLARGTGEGLGSVTEKLEKAAMMRTVMNGSPDKKPPSKIGMSEVDIADAPVMHNYTIATSLAPPSFGHRPGSASRTFNPVTMGVKKEKVRGKAKKGGRTGIMSTSMLKALLTAGDGDGPAMPVAKNQVAAERNSYAFGGDDEASYASTIDTVDRGTYKIDTEMDAQEDFYNLEKSPSHLPTPTNHKAFFDSTYVVPPKTTKPSWDQSFVQRDDDVRNSRPILTLNRDDRDTSTLARIERFRLLAAGKTVNVTGSEGRDNTDMKSEWREEMDRKFYSGMKNSGAKISPRSQAINRDVQGILQVEKNRQRKLDQKIREWEGEVAKERTAAIVSRRRGKKNIVDFN